MRFHTPAFLSRSLRHVGAAAAATPAMPAAGAEMPSVRHDTPRYNAQDGLFEARVDVTRNGATFRYPVRIAAPCDADPLWVSQALVRRALALSDSRLLH